MTVRISPPLPPLPPLPPFLLMLDERPPASPRSPETPAESCATLLSLNSDGKSAERPADSPSGLKVEAGHIETLRREQEVGHQAAPDEIEDAEPIPATVALAKPLPAVSPARNRSSPEQEATQRAMDNPVLWLDEWQAMLKREKLLVSWPVAAGEPSAAGVCGCCGTRSWWLNEDRTQDGSHWVCAACHPPPAFRVVQSKWPPAAAPSPVVAEGAAVSSGAWS